MPSFYEFFAGGGMVRAGLGQAWHCLFANDFDIKKGFAYQLNWGTNGELHVGDVAKVATSQIPGCADLAWASFPCQDLSLAGNGAGLHGERSGTFYDFWALIDGLNREGRGPDIVSLENVVGTLSSHGGDDFRIICKKMGIFYRFGALVIDAANFVPQSRPRLFIIGVRKDLEIPRELFSNAPASTFHTKRLRAAFDSLEDHEKQAWVWWNLPNPPLRNTCFADIIEDDPQDVVWSTSEETDRLIGMMSDTNLAKVAAAKRAGRKVVGGVYKRTRVENGSKVQRAEVRFDEVAGCLRTPGGGSSRQLILVVDGTQVRSRLISARETARLMGLSDEYKLPKKYNDAYHLTGDGVAVPVVRFLAQQIFIPLIQAASESQIRRSVPF